MANLNLSEFGEKLFVADADHTFIWDTANAISKRVSRNSWLNSGTLTSDAPVTISQTWNAGSNVMTALKVVATDTASGVTSNLLELWAGSTPTLDFAVTKAGAIQAYGTYSAAGINYARLALACDSSGNATIATQAAGSGVAGTVSINGVPVGLGKGNVATNVAVGDGALNANTTGLLNVSIGKNSARLITGTNADANTVVGSQALYSAGINTNTITAIGCNSFYNLLSGSYSIVMGQNAASNVTSATSSIFIGSRTTASAASSTNEIVIGESAVGIGSNSVVLGNDSITKTALKGNVGIGTTSPTSKLHVAGSGPAITIENAIATGYSELLFKNTVATGTSIFLNGSAQSGYGGASSLNIYSSSGPIAFHTTSVTNALSIAQSGAVSCPGSFSASGSISAGNTLSLGGFTVILKDLGSAKLQILNSAQNVGCTLDAATDGYAKFRLRNSSTVFAAVQGKLTTDTDYTATVVTPTGFLTLYDAQGNAYKVPCVAA